MHGIRDLKEPPKHFNHSKYIWFKAVRTFKDLFEPGAYEVSKKSQKSTESAGNGAGENSGPDGKSSKKSGILLSYLKMKIWFE